MYLKIPVDQVHIVPIIGSLIDDTRLSTNLEEIKKIE